MIKNLFRKPKTIEPDMNLIEKRNSVLTEACYDMKRTAEKQTVQKTGKQRNAKLTRLNDTVEEIPYYWAEGHDGKIFLTSLLETGIDKVTVIDMKTEAKELLL